MSDHTDNPAFEYAAQTVGTDSTAMDELMACPDRADCPHVREAAGSCKAREGALQALRQVLIATMDAATDNPNRVMATLYSVAGFSLRDIGARLHMSQEGVRKHLRAVGRRNPALGALLQQHYGADTAYMGEMSVLDLERRARKELANVGAGWPEN